MRRTELWAHIHHERRTLAGTLADLDPEQWETASLCTGWTVRDVAAHVISNPQIGLGTVLGLMARNLGRGYNEMIYRDVRRRGRQPVERILDDFDRLATSRAHVPTTTSVEPLVDALLHHQDVARPLGVSHPMDPAAARVAGDRVRMLAPLLGTRRLVRSVRMVATDVDWDRGRGPVVEGPVGELLMLASGRDPAPGSLSGEGLDAALRTMTP